MAGDCVLARLAIVLALLLMLGREGKATPVIAPDVKGPVLVVQ